MATDQQDTHTAALATPGAGPQMCMVQVALIEESPHNPRKTFDPAKLQELADSIAATGVHQPILLRPLPASRVPDTFAARPKGAPLPAYELVAGARRLRACKLAKVLEVPAMIRELTDSQALEIAIVENLQREDVSELEEAEGYEALMQHGDLTAEAVGAKIGKSRSYVYARLKLLDLCQEGRRSLREGKIDASKALLLARIPDHALQIKALKHIEPGDYGHAMSYRDAAAYIQREYMLRLDAARFKITDAALLPSAGACRDCTKRTGYAPELFTDVKSADVCTDPKCYRAKEEAHSNNTKREALARGQTIIDGREAKELMPSRWSSRVEGYLRLDDAADSPTDKPLRKLIGKAMEQQGVQPTLIANPHHDGELVAVLLPAQVNELLKAQGHAEAADQVAGEAQQSAKHAAAQAKADAKAAFERAWRWELLEATWQRLNGEVGHHLSPAMLRHLAIGKARSLNTDRAKRLCKLLDLGKVAPVAGIEGWVADHEAPAAALQLLVMEADVEHRPWLPDDSQQNAGLFLVSEHHGIDPEAIKAQTQANQRADAAQAKAQAQAKAKKAAQSLDTEAPESASTQPPAALAGEVRGGGAGGRKGTRPAARAATEQPRTSKEHASAQIASALQALEDQNQAPAAQSNEGAPAPSGGCTGDAAPENTAAPVDPSIAWPHLKAGVLSKAIDSAAAPTAKACADATTGAAIESASALAIGVQVRVLPTANGPKQAPHVGKHGTIARQVGTQAWDVAIPRAKRGVPVFVAFHSSELEVAAQEGSAA